MKSAFNTSCSIFSEWAIVKNFNVMGGDDLSWLKYYHHETNEFYKLEEWSVWSGHWKDLISKHDVRRRANLLYKYRPL